MAGASEQGTLKNNTNVTLSYQAGHADSKGHVAWQTYTLAPGQSHVWTVQNPKTQPLALMWDLKLGDAEYTATRNGLPTRPGGCLDRYQSEPLSDRV